MLEAINQRNNGGKGAGSIDKFAVVAAIMNVMHHFLGVSWNAMSGPLGGNCVLSDNLHLNEDGGEIVSDAVVEWLFRKNIHKAIAVKQF